MKAFPRTTFIYATLVVVAVVAAYYFGWSRGMVPVKSESVSQKSIINAPIGTSQAIGPKAPERLTREQILEQLKDILKKPGKVSAPGFFPEIMDKIFPEDIPFLLDELAKLPSSSDRSEIIDQLISSMIGIDPLNALSKMSLVADARRRTYMTNEILGIILSRNTDQAVEILAKLPPGQETQETYLSAFFTWSDANPDFGSRAATAALGLPASPEQIAALEGAAKGWAYNDPQAALAWAGNLPPVDEIVLNAAILTAEKKQPQLAAQYVDKLTDAADRSGAIQAIAVNWALGQTADPAGALGWLDQVATGDTYDKSVINIISTLAQKHPSKAATLLANITEPGVRGQLIGNVASAWGARDSQSTSEWLQSLPDSDQAARDAAMQKLAQTSVGN